MDLHFLTDLRIALFVVAVASSLGYLFFQYMVIPYWKNQKEKNSAKDVKHPNPQNLAHLEQFYDDQIADSVGWRNDCANFAVVLFAFAILSILV